MVLLRLCIRPEQPSPKLCSNTTCPGNNAAGRCGNLPRVFREPQPPFQTQSAPLPLHAFSSARPAGSKRFLGLARRLRRAALLSSADSFTNVNPSFCLRATSLRISSVLIPLNVEALLLLVTYRKSHLTSLPV